MEVFDLNDMLVGALRRDGTVFFSLSCIIHAVRTISSSPNQPSITKSRNAFVNWASKQRPVTVVNPNASECATRSAREPGSRTRRFSIADQYVDLRTALLACAYWGTGEHVQQLLGAATQLQAKQPLAASASSSSTLPVETKSQHQPAKRQRIVDPVRTPAKAARKPRRGTQSGRGRRSHTQFLMDEGGLCFHEPAVMELAQEAVENLESIVYGLPADDPREDNEAEVKEGDGTVNFEEDEVYEPTTMTRKSLCVYLYYHFITENMQVNHAAHHASRAACVTERSVYNWVGEYKRTRAFTRSRRGRAGDSRINEPDVRAHLVEWISTNAKANNTRNRLTIARLRQHVNTKYKTNISQETARRWLHKLGFRLKAAGNGPYIDGHERKDVVEARQAYITRVKQLTLRRIVLHEVPSMEDQQRWARLPLNERPLVFGYQDESSFKEHEGFGRAWMLRNQNMMARKSPGSGMMISGFITELHGGCVPALLLV